MTGSFIPIKYQKEKREKIKTIIKKFNTENWKIDDMDYALEDVKNAIIWCSTIKLAEILTQNECELYEGLTKDKNVTIIEYWDFDIEKTQRTHYGIKPLTLSWDSEKDSMNTISEFYRENPTEDMNVVSCDGKSIYCTSRKLALKLYNGGHKVLRTDNSMRLLC